MSKFFGRIFSRDLSGEGSAEKFRERKRLSFDECLGRFVEFDGFKDLSWENQNLWQLFNIFDTFVVGLLK